MMEMDNANTNTMNRTRSRTSSMNNNSTNTNITNNNNTNTNTTNIPHGPVLINNDVLSALFHQKPELTEYIYLELMNENLL